MHVCWVASVVSDSLRCYGLKPIRFLCPYILQARILERVAMPSSRRSSRPRDWTHISYVSCTGRWVLLPLIPPRKPYWSLVELEYCIKYFCTAKWIQLYVCIIFHIFFCYGLSQILNIVPWLFCKTLLFIHSIYTSLNLLIPNSHSVSAFVTTSLFSVLLILFQFHRQVPLYHILLLLLFSP